MFLFDFYRKFGFQALQRFARNDNNLWPGTP